MVTIQGSAAFIMRDDDDVYSSSVIPNPLRILQIEDNASDALFVKHELKYYMGERPISVVNVSTMCAAFEMLNLVDFHIALLDLNLLDSEGAASVAALHAEMPAIPIIVLSGTDDPKLKAEALLCGARGYLVKGKESSDVLIRMMRDALIHSNTNK